MSVTKDGVGRPQLRPHQQRPAPPGDLPGRRRRDHGRRRGRQRQPQRVAQHPGQLQRGHHRLGAGRHRWQAGRARRQSLLLVGRLRQGRHVRQLQQLRRRRRHHGPRQMHHVHDPRPRLRLHVGHVDGRARRSPARSRSTRRAARRPRRPRSARPCATSATSTGRPRPTPIRPTSRCSTCRGSASSGPSP